MDWSLPPLLPRPDFLTKEIRSCCQEAKWSQSPVLPWAQRAYETCLSVGSTAELDPPPRVAPNWLAYRASASLPMLWGP